MTPKGFPLVAWWVTITQFSQSLLQQFSLTFYTRPNFIFLSKLSISSLSRTYQEIQFIFVKFYLVFTINVSQTRIFHTRELQIKWLILNSVICSLGSKKKHEVYEDFGVQKIVSTLLNGHHYLSSFNPIWETSYRLRFHV